MVYRVTHSEHFSRSDWRWKARDSRARAVLCKTFTPSKKNMSHTLSTDGQGNVLYIAQQERYHLYPTAAEERGSNLLYMLMYHSVQ